MITKFSNVLGGIEVFGQKRKLSNILISTYALSSHELFSLLEMAKRNDRQTNLIIVLVVIVVLVLIILRRDAGIQDVTVHTLGDDCE